MQRLKIAHAIESCGAGVGRHVLDLSAGQAARGHDVTIIYSPARAEDRFLAELGQIAGVRVRPITMYRGIGPWDLISWRALTREIRTTGPFDVIHGHSSKAGALIRLLPPTVPGARIYTTHAMRVMDPGLGKLARAFYQSIERLLGALRCEAVIVGSRHELDAVLAAGMNRSKISVVVNGISRCELPSRSQARALLGLPSDIPVVGFVGRLVAQKAPERAVRALAAMKNKKARLVMLGAGDLEGEIRTLTNYLGVADRVLIRSGLEGQWYMPAFDVLLCTSRYESMGYIFLEANAAGVPIIATPVGIAEEIISSGIDGAIVPNDEDPQPFAEALDATIKRTVLTGKDILRRNSIYRTVDAMVDETLDIYAKVLNRASVQPWSFSTFKKIR